MKLTRLTDGPYDDPAWAQESKVDTCSKKLFTDLLLSVDSGPSVSVPPA
jgi:hypothetical protein